MLSWQLRGRLGTRATHISCYGYDRLMHCVLYITRDTACMLRAPCYICAPAHLLPALASANVAVYTCPGCTIMTAALLFLTIGLYAVTAAGSEAAVSWSQSATMAALR